jgi:hypothetical protein
MKHLVDANVRSEPPKPAPAYAGSLISLLPQQRSALALPVVGLRQQLETRIRGILCAEQEAPNWAGGGAGRRRWSSGWETTWRRQSGSSRIRAALSFIKGRPFTLSRRAGELAHGCCGH